MDEIKILYFVLAVIIILVRGPLIFAPQATRDFYLKLLSTNTRIRIMGIMPLLFAMLIIRAAQGHDQMEAVFIRWLGYWMVFLSVFAYFIFTSLFKLIANSVLQAMDKVMLVGLGILSLILSAVFLAIGIKA